MPCSNCYNGCPEIVSDQCVKYTGVDVSILGIKTGDSLSYVEAALVEFLTSTLDGTGIKPDISLTSPYLCNLVKQYLPDCEDITAANLFEALIKAACDLQVQVTGNTASITSIQTTLAILNGNYNIGCLSGVISSSDTHDVLQAVITKLCQFITDVNALYVKIADINSYIAAYISSNPAPVPDKWCDRMIPYTVVEFWGDIAPDAIYPGSGFTAGVGYGRFEKLYLCNGQIVGPIVTPDKRGRVTVGATQDVGGGAMDPAVNPGGFNPIYSQGSKTGTNSVTLTLNQIPTHNHTASSVVVEPNGGLGHKHSLISGYFAGSDGRGTSVSSSGSDVFNWASGRLGTNVVDYSTTGITVNTTVASNGGSEAHPNNQPAIGAYYIMYIP